MNGKLNSVSTSKPPYAVHVPTKHETGTALLFSGVVTLIILVGAVLLAHFDAIHFEPARGSEMGFVLFGVAAALVAAGEHLRGRTN